MRLQWQKPQVWQCCGFAFIVSNNCICRHIGASCVPVRKIGGRRAVQSRQYAYEGYLFTNAAYDPEGNLVKGYIDSRVGVSDT